MHAVPERELRGGACREKEIGEAPGIGLDPPVRDGVESE
jgi:hypothetical protein